MFRRILVTAILVGLSLTGLAQNPFEQQAAADFSGLFVSREFVLQIQFREGGKAAVNAVRRQNGTQYSGNGALCSRTLQGTLTGGSSALPFSLEQKGTDYIFTVGNERTTIKKLPPLDYSGEWGSMDGSVRVQLDGTGGGTAIFDQAEAGGEKRAVLSGNLTPIGIIGTMTYAGTDPVQFGLMQVPEEDVRILAFNRGAESTPLRSWRELNRRRKELRERLDDPSLPKLHAAAGRGDLDKFKELLKSGEFIDQQAESADGAEPAHFAALFGRLNILKFIASQRRNRADYVWSLRDEEFCTKRDLEKEMGHLSISLVSMGVTKKEMTRLYLAKSAEIRKRFIEKRNKQRNEPIGYTLTSSDEDGAHPIHYAAVGGSLEAIFFLLSNVQNYGATASDHAGAQPIHYAVRGGCLDLLVYLITAGVPVDSKDREDETPLHWAARLGKVEFIRFLASKGADVNAKNKQGRTPLSVARRYSPEPKAGKLLRELGGR